MSRLTFAEAEYPIKKRKIRRERILDKLKHLLPWKQVEAPIARNYPHGGIGRPPYPRSAMLRIHVIQLVYKLSDPAMKVRDMKLSRCLALPALRWTGCRMNDYPELSALS